MFVTVAVNIPAEKTFTYAVPQSLRKETAIGKRVLVPFGRRKATGFILEHSDSTDQADVREILECPDEEPLFDAGDLRFYRWISSYYLYPLGKILAEILPAGTGRKHKDWIRPAMETVVSALREIRETDIRLTKRQRDIASFIASRGPMTLTALRQTYPSASSMVRTLSERGILVLSEREIYRGPLKAPSFGGDVKPIVLNDRQEACRLRISRALKSGGFAVLLLHGVTGSGKTEVYLRAMEEVVNRGEGAMYLVPEIALTPQLLCRVRERFPGEEIAVLHSGIPRTSRYDQWRKIQRGEIRVVVGARSAVFAPLRHLRLIVVDEEHDTSYKQDERLPYNGRDMAVAKAQRHSAVVVLGSATPSVQTYHHAKTERYDLLQLPDRVEKRPMPPVEIVDMRSGRATLGGNGIPVFSPALAEAIRETRTAGKQTLLFLNRRGFSTFVVCLECGYSFKCRNCSVSLTHHAGTAALKCHYCDYSVKAPPLCPACGGGNIRNHGVGTEKVEAEAKRLFPEARICRMDSDTTAKKGSLDGILRSFSKGEIDILIGTQMIAKGHDYAGVTLVGIVSADVSLNLPDFRAAERTFQLLTQVAGRSGRGDLPGRVIVQTLNPDHYAILRAKDHDFEGFYREEIALRRSLRYPPFSRLVALHLSGLNKKNAERAVLQIGADVRTMAAAREWSAKVEISGPAASPIGKIRGRHRWQILLKGRDVRILHVFAKAVLETAKGSGLEIRADVDPVHFL